MSKNVIQLIGDWYLKKVITNPGFTKVDAMKDIDLLLPEFKVKVLNAIFEFEKTHSYKVVFVETLRSAARQLMHFNNGASKIRKGGMHEYAIACDCAFNIDGHFSYDGDYAALRLCFSNQGLFLLGDWDKGHVQLISVQDQTELRRSVDYDIREFQRKYKLTVDGIVGKNTISKAKEIYGVQ